MKKILGVLLSTSVILASGAAEARDHDRHDGRWNNNFSHGGFRHDDHRFAHNYGRFDRYESHGRGGYHHGWGWGGAVAGIVAAGAALAIADNVIDHSVYAEPVYVEPQPVTYIQRSYPVVTHTYYQLAYTEAQEIW